MQLHGNGNTGTGGTRATSHWRVPPVDPDLSTEQIHLWRATLDLPPHRLRPLAALLTPDESARAARFRQERDRTRFIAARGLLRSVLGLYLHREPREVRFRYQAFGKPELAESRREDLPLRFNLSHSDGLALIAVTRCRAVGVDVERVRDIGELDGILSTAFAAGERAALRQLAEKERQFAFFRGWVCKEAFVKATGAGLSQAPNDVEIAFMPGRPARLLTVNGDPCIGQRWGLQEIRPAPDAVAAVVVEGRPAPLRLWEWPTALESYEADPSDVRTEAGEIVLEARQ